MLSRLRAGLATAALALASVSAEAQLVTNGTPDFSSGNEMTQWVQGENFTLASASTLTAVRFWAGTFTGFPGWAGSIFWAIGSGPAAGPTSIIFSGTATGTRTTLGASGVFDQTYRHDFELPNLNLNAGSYFLLLHNGPLSRVSRDEYYWAGATGGSAPTGVECNSNNTAFPSLGSCAWFNNSNEHAFVLFGTAGAVVPEPSTYTLMVTGLAGLGAVARRRRAVKG